MPRGLELHDVRDVRSAPSRPRASRAQATRLRGQPERVQVLVDVRPTGVHRVDRQMGRTGRTPALDLTRGTDRRRRVARSRGLPCRWSPGPVPRRAAAPRMMSRARVEVGPGADLGEPAVGEPADPAVGRVRRAADPDRDRPLDGQRARGRPPSPGRRCRRTSPTAPSRVARSRRDLLGHAASALIEGLAERLVLDGVPPEPDAEPEPAAGQQVHLRGLLRDERGLALREDDDAGHELEST